VPRLSSGQVLRLTLEETEARLPGSRERPGASGVQTAAQLAFVPLAAAAYMLVRQASGATAFATCPAGALDASSRPVVSTP
jgi:hypothetical protein